MDHSAKKTDIKTLTGRDIKWSTLGILYFYEIEYPMIEYPLIKIVHEIHFANDEDAFNHYSESWDTLLASGQTQEDFLEELEELHRNIKDPDWVKKLEYGLRNPPDLTATRKAFLSLEEFTIKINGSGTLEGIKIALRKLADKLDETGEYNDDILKASLDEE